MKPRYGYGYGYDTIRVREYVKNFKFRIRYGLDTFTIFFNIYILDIIAQKINSVKS
jgi:hypothetical protein